jgi:hypothetical protein
VADNPRTLWDQFIFCARRLDLRAVRLEAEGGELSWSDVESQSMDDFEDVHDVPFGAGVRLCFRGSPRRLDQRTFLLTTELAAEAWLRALRHWRATHDRDWSLRESLERSAPARPS